MFSKIVSCGIRGVEGYQVAIETDISSGGLPSLTMVGYLSEEVREAQERVRTALRNSAAQKNYHQSFSGRTEKGRYCL